MSGTGPMNELAIRTAVRLAVGLSKVPRMQFQWGQPANPLSVGLRGQWAVLADGLQDIHFYLGFDGRQLLVAPGGPGAALLLNGQPLQGQAWVPVTVPAQIQAGGALLRVENEAAFAAEADAPVNSSVDTLFDGGVLRERGRALATPAPIAPMAVLPTVLSPSGARAAPFGATLRSPTDQPEPAPPAPARSRSQPEVPQATTNSPSTPPPTALTQPPVAAKKGAWAEASGPKKASLVLMPFALATMMWVLLDDSEVPLAGLPTSPVAAKPAAATPDPVSSQAPVRQRLSLAKTPAGPDTLAATAAAAAAANEQNPAEPKVADPKAVDPKAPASQATEPKAAEPKVPEPKAAEPSAATQASASPAPSAAPAASTSAVPIVPAPLGSAAQLSTSARAALSAALLGNLDQAADLYTRLSAAQPDNEAFRLAARLTAAHAVRRP